MVVNLFRLIRYNTLNGKFKLIQSAYELGDTVASDNRKNIGYKLYKNYKLLYIILLANNKHYLFINYIFSVINWHIADALVENGCTLPYRKSISLNSK